MTMNEELERVRSDAVCVASEIDVQRAFDAMARAIEGAQLAGPVVLLCVMNGALVVAAELLKRLSMPLTLDYIHASRYREQTRGASIEWKAVPGQSLEHKSVIVVDDIFDEGITLDAIRDYCLEQGAGQVLTAVLVDKQHERKAQRRQPDVVGLALPDHYLFGVGMDYKGYLRNSPAIFAAADH